MFISTRASRRAQKRTAARRFCYRAAPAPRGLGFLDGARRVFGVAAPSRRRAAHPVDTQRAAGAGERRVLGPRRRRPRFAKRRRARRRSGRGAESRVVSSSTAEGQPRAGDAAQGSCVSMAQQCLFWGAATVTGRGANRGARVSHARGCDDARERVGNGLLRQRNFVFETSAETPGRRCPQLDWLIGVAA